MFKVLIEEYDGLGGFLLEVKGFMLKVHLQESLNCLYIINT